MPSADLPTTPPDDPRYAQEADDPRSPYLGPARAWSRAVADIHDEAGVKANAALVMQMPWFRAAVDAAREPLLVRNNHLDAQLADAHGLSLGSAALEGRLAEVTRQRDEARAKVDGGEWQWGVRWAGLDGKPIDWLQGVTETGAREFVAESDNGATLVRRRVGPVEPVSDDGSGT